MALPTILFDDGLGVLSPLNDTRAAFDIRCGGLTLAERVALTPGLSLAGVITPPRLTDLTAHHHRDVPVDAPALPHGDVLAINGRWTSASLTGVAGIKPDEMWTHERSGALVAARANGSRISAALRGDASGFSAVTSIAHDLLLERPWHIAAHRQAAMDADFGLVRDWPSAPPPPGVVVLGHTSGHALSIDPGARLVPTVVLDLSAGAIRIDAGASIRPGAILIGPCWIGSNSTILERAIIRPYTAIGPHCKIAGEVSATTFQGYSNKAHEGFIGDSWVGEWVNLGAGTTNSNLLNTYGEVIARAAPTGTNERTGLQFLGAIIGDHVKTAICTRMMTGCVIHTGVMWAATAPVSGCIPPFAWVTDAGRHLFRFEKFHEVAQAMMARRAVTQSPAASIRLQALHAEAAAMWKE